MVFFTLDDKLLSVLEDLPLKINESTVFADIMSTYGLIPNEVRDDVYSFIEMEDYTNEFLNSYILQAFKDCLSTNGQELVQQLVMLLEKYEDVLNIGNIPQMKKKTLCKFFVGRINHSFFNYTLDESIKL